MHRIDPDVVGAVLHRRGLGQGADRALRGVIGDMDAVLAGDAGDRRDFDDRASARRLHDRDREFHAEKDAARVDRHQPVPGRGVEEILDLNPASLTRMSSLPYSANVASTVAFHSASLLTSSRRNIAAPLALVMSATTPLPS